MTGARHPVFRLELPLPEALYESALVLGLPGPLAEAVEDLRARLAWEAPAEHQLTPHLTVLFLGRMPGSRLLELHHVLSGLRPVEAGIGLGGLETFGSGSTVTNLHLRVTGDAAVRALHERALESCRAAGWEPQTRYLGGAYVPHITVFDQVEVPAGSFVLPPAPPAATWRLHDLHLIAKRLRPDGSAEAWP
jgi:2'-5' RNA ligase